MEGTGGAGKVKDGKKGASDPFARPTPGQVSDLYIYTITSLIYNNILTTFLSISSNIFQQAGKVPSVAAFMKGASPAQAAQLEMIKEVFAQMDADADGLLSMGDVRAYFRTIGRNASDLVTRRWIRSRDIDQDGAGECLRVWNLILKSLNACLFSRLLGCDRTLSCPLQS